MRIEKIYLQNFKRFTNLRIEQIPSSAKLVLLIGANGSGKSSLFDAFELINSIVKDDSIIKNQSKDYFVKESNQSLEINISFHELGEYKIYSQNNIFYISPANTEKSLQPDSFYGRTSFRQVSRLTRTTLGQGGRFDLEKDSDRPRFFIDKDDRFENDIEKITEIILNEVFTAGSSNEEIRQRFINPINKAFENILGAENGTQLQLLKIIPPIEGRISQITFSKGKSEIHYNHLSAGEKEVFNLLVNLLSRSSLYQETIYFLDEIDLHLNTKLQYHLLKEITENWIPENSQLWVATHSLGFIEYANDYSKGAILDFDNLDFDNEQLLAPSDKNNYQVFELAVSRDFIEKVFKDNIIVFSEESDTVYYNNLGIKNTFFFDGKDKLGAFERAKNFNKKALVDRDYLTDEEIEALRSDYPFLCILPYYSIENLFYHPDNLAEYYGHKGIDFDREKYINDLREIKDKKILYIASGIAKARDGYPYYKENQFASKLKSFKGNYNAIVNLLNKYELEEFYKVFPAKDYGKELAQKQNLRKQDLSRTTWFGRQIALALEPF